MICKNCNTENIEEAKFCRGCGANLEEQKELSHEADTSVEIPQQSEFVVCGNCHNQNKQGMTFCCYCGASLQAGAVSAEVPANFDVNIAPAQNKTKGKKNALIIFIIIAVIIAGGVAALLVLDPFSSDDKKSETETTYADDWSQSGDESQVDWPEASTGKDTSDTPDRKRYSNIIDDTGSLTDEEMQAIDNKIAGKEYKTNVNILIGLVNNKNGTDLTKYTETYFQALVGNEGILVLLDLDNYTAHFCVKGEGKDFITAEIKQNIINKTSLKIKEGGYKEACEIVVDSILDSKKVSRFETVAGAEQVVFVEKNSGSNTGKLTLVEWIDGEEQVLYEINKVYLGKDGITSSPSETKSATPKGTFALGFAFSDKKLSTKLDSRVIKSGDVWVDDPDSEYYNTLQNGSTSNSKWSSAENTYYSFSSGLFEACILIEHNGDGYTKGISGKGSCIYISGKNKELSSSYGDVNISADQMETLLSYLDEAKNPHIVIK